MNLKRLGTEYGGWIIPIDLVNSRSIIYSAGVGEDVSFDVALVKHVGCEVYLFDPTPRAATHVQKHPNDKFIFSDVGVWSEDTKQRFYTPKDPTHVSHSIGNLQKTKKFFDAECLTLKSIMKQNNHDHIDLLKMDIEGAEYAVIHNMLDTGILPTTLCVEFHGDTGDTKKKLSEVGYVKVAKHGNTDFTYVMSGT